jgi:hypothetical protein
MTPAVIRTISQLRQEFYSLFAAAMEIPVKVTNGNSYASNLSMASWIDGRHRLNYVCVYAHTAPDELFPERPFILQLNVNKGVDVIAIARRSEGCQGYNRSWHFALTLLPEEILDFPLWLVSLVNSYETDSASFLPEPPHPFDSKASNMLLFHEAWTRQAGSKLSQKCGSPEFMVEMLV